MRPAYFKALLAGGLIFPAGAPAAESASELRLAPLAMPETRTLPAAGMEMTGQAELLRYNDPDSSESVTDVDLAPELAFGITDALEMGLSGLYRQRVDDQQRGDWRHVAGRITYRFLDLPKRSSALTLRGSTLDDNSDAQVSSGRNAYSAAWHMSRYTDSGAAHIALGYAQRDYPLVQEEPAYESETEYFGQWGFGRLLAPELALTGELTYTYAKEEEQGSLEILPGFRYTGLESGLSLAMGLGFRPGIDDHRPNSRVLLSLTYRPPGPAGLSNRMDHLEEKVGSMQGELKGISEQLAERKAREKQEAEKPAPEPAPEPSKASAAISLGLINTSGVKGLAEEYAERLRRMGYQVARVAPGEGPVQSVTHLYYREGLNKAAVTLGRALPGTQSLVHYTHLPDEVDIQVQMGADLAEGFEGAEKSAGKAQGSPEEDSPAQDASQDEQNRTPAGEDADAAED